MAFSIKTWVNRISEFPSRRALLDEGGTTTIVTVSRSEGTIQQEGDAFNAENMNNLEGRIQQAFADDATALEEATAVTNLNVTLVTVSWSSGVYTIRNNAITATSTQIVSPAVNISSAQMDALLGARIIDAGQSAGTMTLKCLGDVPTVDIPIRIQIRSK